MHCMKFKPSNIFVANSASENFIVRPIVTGRFQATYLLDCFDGVCVTLQINDLHSTRASGESRNRQLVADCNEKHISNHYVRLIKSLISSSSSFLTNRPLTLRRLSAKFFRTSYLTFFVQTR